MHGASKRNILNCTRTPQIADGVAKDTQVWDEELEMYVYGGTVKARNEPSINVPHRLSAAYTNSPLLIAILDAPSICMGHPSGIY
eukprot:COSAG05_NODE_11352_length_517_cov_1.665072_1_plen_85_part_00